MELLLNKCIGGFGFSVKFCKLFLETYGFELKELCIDGDRDFMFTINIRTNAKVLELFKMVGSKFASSPTSDLEIVTVNDNSEFYIDDIDGVEEIVYTYEDNNIMYHLFINK
jgi:hypothetical protein